MKNVKQFDYSPSRRSTHVGTAANDHNPKLEPQSQTTMRIYCFVWCDVSANRDWYDLSVCEKVEAQLYIHCIIISIIYNNTNCHFILITGLTTIKKSSWWTCVVSGAVEYYIVPLKIHITYSVYKSSHLFYINWNLQHQTTLVWILLLSASVSKNAVGLLILEFEK